MKKHTMSTNVIDYNAVAPEAVRPLYEAVKALAKSGLEQNLLTLVELRASQLNRCAFCLALHMREGQALGESLDRLSGVAAWREASWYSPRERAALEFTEALTALAAAHPSSDLLPHMREVFTDRELVYLILAINTINAWNRFNVAFGTPPEKAEAVFRQLHPAAAAS